ncbi:N-alpha-acetyltransferase 80-like [Dendronephthya gigantea]|uniref:N-alpha-acetyltransferase 80-like n=1 Tax=Dendronephthya gigantea TaxID=151771 RepID=UPI001069AF29|nr:N-alpha-acetyltransferase 80-like [Dendronephthya gigantea]
MEHEFKVAKLHDVPHFIEETAQLINSEWPRSLKARCDVIGQSSDHLPCSFILLKVSADGNEQTVVGFSRLFKVLHKSKSCLVESVIVDKSLRGCGLGRMIMKYTEEFATKYGYEIMHLSTHDKQSFYEHLGYSLSTPVSAESKVSRFFPKSKIEDKCNFITEKDSLIKCANELNTTDVVKLCPSVSPQNTLSSTLSLSSPIPKPPPPPPLAISCKPSTQGANMGSLAAKNIEKGSKVIIWMEKNLSY